MIRCPSCNSRAGVADVRTTRSSVRRIRACTVCPYRWTTYELTKDLGALIARMTKEFEPTRRRLKHLEEELLLMEKLLNSVSLATQGKGPKAPLRYAIHDVISRCRPWSESDVKVLDELYPDYGSVVVAERLGRTTNAVQQQAHKRKVKRDHASKTRKVEENHIRKHTPGGIEWPTAEAGSSYRPGQVPVAFPSNSEEGEA